MPTVTDGRFELIVAGPTGFANNIYIVVDKETGESAFIDAPDVEKCAEAADAAGLRPSAILLTHSHADHTAGIDGLKKKYGCKVYADPKEPWLKDNQIDEALEHNQTLNVGSLQFAVFSVPGHTPGSTTFLYGKHAFVGDTLFPGGPGRTQTNSDLQDEIRSINEYLYMLPNETIVWPGHGDNTTIEKSKAEYAVFASKEHDPELCGDVNWLTS